MELMSTRSKALTIVPATQLAARLKLAQMWNHNGTNMDGIGFMYRSYRVLMELQGDTPHGTHAVPNEAFPDRKQP